MNKQKQNTIQEAQVRVWPCVAAPFIAHFWSSPTPVSMLDNNRILGIELINGGIQEMIEKKLKQNQTLTFFLKLIARSYHLK